MGKFLLAIYLKNQDQKLVLKDYEKHHNFCVVCRIDFGSSGSVAQHHNSRGSEETSWSASGLWKRIRYAVFLDASFSLLTKSSVLGTNFLLNIRGNWKKKIHNFDAA